MKKKLTEDDFFNVAKIPDENKSYRIRTKPIVKFWNKVNSKGNIACRLTFNNAFTKIHKLKQDMPCSFSFHEEKELYLLVNAKQAPYSWRLHVGRDRSVGSSIFCSGIADDVKEHFQIRLNDFIIEFDFELVSDVKEETMIFRLFNHNIIERKKR